MRLIAFKYGATEITERMAFQDGSEDVKLPVSLLFFLIEHKNKKILVDAGCDTMPGFKLIEFEKPARVLESYGIKCTDITDVIITHSHHDHIDAVYNYRNANIYLQKEEAKAASVQNTSVAANVCPSCGMENGAGIMIDRPLELLEYL